MPPAIENEPEPTPEVEEMGQGKRICKASAYVRHIQDGEDSATNLPASRTLPLGMQPVPEEGKLAECCMVATAEDFAMATVLEAAEGLNPSYEEVKKRLDWPKWEEAIKAELASLEKNGTWRIVERPASANVIDCKWVLRIKKNAAGEVDKYKA